MADNAASYAIMAAAVLALLTGCAAGGEDQLRTGSTGSVSTSAPVPVRPAPLLAPDRLVLASGSDQVLFDLDRADLSPEARRRIEGWAQWLKDNPSAWVVIEGHCDERGTREYNLGLGARRAAAVRELMIALGIDARRLSTLSYGKERPAVHGSTEAAWARNRRAVAAAQLP